MKRMAGLLFVCSLLSCSGDHGDEPPADSAVRDRGRGSGKDAATEDGGDNRDAAAANPFNNPPPQVPIDAGHEQDAAHDEVVDASWHGEVPVVCDGSNSVRLGFQLAADLEQNAAYVMYQNGWPYWVLTGDCHYYVMQDPRAPLREGSLTVDEAQEVGRRLHFGQLDGRLYASEPTVVHAGVWGVYLGGEFVRCVGSCEEDAPPEVQDAIISGQTLVDELYAQGSDWDGPVRIACLEGGGSADRVPSDATYTRVIDWPLISDPASVCASYDDLFEGRYAGALVVDLDDLDALRAVRGRYYLKFNGSQFIVRNTDESHYVIAFRDAIPLEDESTGELQLMW